MSPCVLVFYITRIIADYFKYDIITQIDVIYEISSVFPTVSICSTSAWKNEPDFDLKSMLLYCRFDGDINCKLNSSLFEPFIDPIYNLCYRFNSMSKKSKTTGLTNGLELELKLKIADDYDFGELLINIHNSSYKSLDLENNG